MFFVTGAGGFIGGRICQRLAANGSTVTAFCHQPPAENSIINNDPLIRIAIGEIENRDNLSNAMRGNKYCFHLAGLAKQWACDRTAFHRINVDGTRNVLDVAVDCGLSKVVFTSTAGIYGPSTGASILDEDSRLEMDGKTDYERTKHEAETIVRQFATDKLLNACIVNPTRVFGPGPFVGSGPLGDSNKLTLILERLSQRKRMLFPRPRFVGNYVYLDDVVNGHLLAMELGVSGRNYILGGTNLRSDKLLSLMTAAANLRTPKIHYVPYAGIMAYAKIQTMWARVSGQPPKLTPPFVNKYLADCYLSSERAKQELGYEPRSIEQGLQETLEWIRERAISC